MATTKRYVCRACGRECVLTTVIANGQDVAPMFCPFGPRWKEVE